MRFDEDLAVIHAYLCADGYVVKNPPTQKQKYYRVGLRNTNLLLLNDFRARFERLWGVRPRLLEGQRCEKGSKEIYETLTKNFGSFYSWEWRMPNLNIEISKAWLRTYFDCEGWVSIETHKSRLIGVDCVNFYGIKQVKSALARLGIESKIKKRKVQNIFRLYIYGKGNLIKFKEKVGFYHPEKSMKLKRAIDDYIVYDWSFPKGSKKLNNFIRTLMHERAKVRSDNGAIRVTSIRKSNLIILKKDLDFLFSVESKLEKMVNGAGTHYYQLNIYKKEEAEKVIANKLLNKIEEGKWLGLRR